MPAPPVIHQSRSPLRVWQAVTVRDQPLLVEGAAEVILPK